MRMPVTLDQCIDQLANLVEADMDSGIWNLAVLTFVTSRVYPLCRQ